MLINKKPSLNNYQRKNVISVAFKIGLIILVTSLITIIISTVGINKIRDMYNVADIIFQDNTNVLFPLSDAQQAIYSSQIFAIQMVEKNKTDSISEYYSEINNANGQLNNLKNFIDPNMLEEYTQTFDNFEKAATNLYNEISREGPNINRYYDTFNSRTKELLDFLYLINRKSRIEGMRTYDQGKEIYQSVIFLQTSITIFGVVISIILALLVSFSIIMPLKKLRKTTELLATGNLQAKVEIKSKDEIGAVATVYNKAIDELRFLVTDASAYAQNINASSTELFRVVDETSRSLGELNKLVEELAKGATFQSEKINSAVKTIENAGEDLNRITQTSTLIFDTCREASEEAQRGGTANETMVNAISSVIGKVDGIQNAVEDLAKDLQQVRDITQVIRDISEQTSLLSLNASIEAARAGEQGRGFAVVASSIRKFAVQSQDSSEHINEFINMILAKTTKTVELVAQSVADIENTRDTLNESTRIFVKLVNRVSEITTELNSISAITKGVVEYSQIIITEMNKVANISEDNLAATEEVAATFEQQYAAVDTLKHAALDMRQMAEKLTEAAIKFKL